MISFFVTRILINKYSPNVKNMKKLKSERLWLVIRLHLIFEILKYHKRTVFIIKKSKGQLKLIQDVLEKQIAEVLLSIQRIKELPVPTSLNYLCFLMDKREALEKNIGTLKFESASGFFSEILSRVDMQRHIYNLLHPSINICYIADEKRGVAINTGKEAVMEISKNNEIKFPSSNSSKEFMIFLNKINISGNIMNQDEFINLDFDELVNESVHEKNSQAEKVF